MNGTLAPYTVVGLSYTVLITLDQCAAPPRPSQCRHRLHNSCTPFVSLAFPHLAATLHRVPRRRTWTPAPVASFPPGFIERGADAAPQIPSLRVDAQQDIYGIVWCAPVATQHAAQAL